MALKNTLKVRMTALIIMIIATPMTFALVITMNKFSTALEKEEGTGIVTFNVEQHKPKKKKKQNKENIKVRKQQTSSRRARPVAPLPSLGTGLSGIEIDVPDVEMADLGSVTNSLLGGLGDVVMTEDTVDSRPVPKYQTLVKYPPRARAKNIEGRVVLNIRIGADGRVKQIKVIEAEPLGVFEPSAIAAVRNWMFEPATYNSRAVEVWATLPLEFTLQ